MTERKYKYLAEGWEKRLLPVLESQEYKNLFSFLKEREKAGIKIYPSKSYIFRALKTLDFDKVRVVILGQDPYNGPGQANGFAFSVDQPLPAPPTLRNIISELKIDMMNRKIPKNATSLHGWVNQGVLLLNTILTVEEGNPNSHSGKGWEIFTDAVIKCLSDEKENLVFMLWGKHAQSKEKLINRYKHRILRASHPSPNSAHDGFFGCKHFSETNLFFATKGKPEIDWFNIEGERPKSKSYLDQLGV